VKKPCAACGKQIPSVALDCVFCGKHQPIEGGGDQPIPPSLENTQAISMPAQPLLGAKTSEVSAVVAQLEEHKPDAPANGEQANGEKSLPSQAKLTAAMAAVQLPPELTAAATGGAAEPAPEAKPDAPMPSKAAHTAVMTAVTPESLAAAVETPRASEPVAPVDDARPFLGLSRTLMGVGGVVLVALFFAPWHGVSSWQLLETLGGADFIRQLFYLTGGIVLTASALLPLPFAFRALIGAAVAATPVLLGAGGMIEGWRGLVAGMAILGLPATHLLRAKAKSSTAARGLVMIAVLAVAILYLAPISSVVPIVGVFRMISSGEVGLAVLGIFILIPLVFAGLSLLGLAGRDLTDVGVLLSVLSLLWAPLVVALRGVLIEDGTQLYIALALLWGSAISALSLAQLLSLAARDATA
jgi:hypothetical protein